ncbi:MAG: hypothetical protein JSV10_06580 [Candidatus Zixiibacteriota bacterium]|nr:MAG: hypothetical protein JSV10_06580 [candidate division Zixibacteria bacterium]
MIPQLLVTRASVALIAFLMAIASVVRSEAQEECPTLSVFDHGVGLWCEDDGKWKVGLIAQHEDPVSPQAFWDYGDGQQGDAFTFAPGFLFSDVHKYEPGTYEASLNIEGCPPHTLKFQVPECDVPRCPTINFNPVMGDCDEQSGSQTWIITAILTGGSGQTFSADLLDDGYLRDSGTSSNAVLELSVQKLFTPGAHTVTVDVTSPGFCGDATFNFTVACADDDNDNCITCFCGGSWCCVFWVLFIISIIGAIVTLARAICGVGSWYSICMFFAAAISYAILLATVCDVEICTILLAMAGSGFAGYAVVCGTNIVPPQCNTWLCKKTNIPGTGLEVANLLVIDLIFTFIVILICHGRELL